MSDDKRGLFCVFDLDGTLADDTHRRYLIERPGEKKWDEYYEACDEDTPIIPMCKLFRIIAGRHDTYTAIWTGRSEAVRQKTAKWLLDQGIAPHILRMRPRDDFRSNTDLKEHWLAQCKDKPDLAFDDNLNVVEWWRSEGVMCLAVDEIRY